MHDMIKLSHLGLEDREVRVLKSIFILSPVLKEHYILTDEAGLRQADLVLVNADSEVALNQWDKLSRINPLVKPLSLSSQGKSIDDTDPLKLPIRLPRLIEALEEVVKESTLYEIPVGDTGQGQDFRVLVVDDSFPVRKYMEQKITELVEMPVKLSFAESGEEALLKCDDTPFNLIFLDVMMEGIDGYKVCKAIKSSYSSYVVMLTSKKSPFDKVRGTMSGCDAYITKPPEDQRIRDEIGKSLKHQIKHQKKAAERLELSGNY